MSQTKIKKINDIEGFCKLFKINIPVNEDFDYYINTLKKSNEFGPSSNLDRNIQSFIRLEQFVKDNNFESLSKYKMQELDRIVAFLQNTNAYKRLMESELPKVKLYTKDLFNQIEDNEILLSLDFQSANFSILKTFDSEHLPEIPYSWHNLCVSLGISDCLAQSKSFRQIVFGNTNPKRLQTFQHENIIKIVEYLLQNGYKEEDFVFISHDEIVLKTPSISKILELIEMSDLLSVAANCMPLRSTIFSMKKIRKNVFVKSIYSILLGHKEFNTDDKYYLKEEYKTLHGVPGNKFYMYFKQYILNEEPEDKDLVYFNDGELCKWVVQVDKSKNNRIPHYNKPKLTLSEEQVSEEYPYLWNKMDEILPGLLNEEKRRLLELLSNTCKSCMDAELGCVCWNDE